jgi:hypothetical protein
MFVQFLECELNSDHYFVAGTDPACPLLFCKEQMNVKPPFVMLPLLVKALVPSWNLSVNNNYERGSHKI